MSAEWRERIEMSRLLHIATLALLLASIGHAAALPQRQDVPGPADGYTSLSTAPLTHCIAFSAYVDGYDPISGPHPGPELVDQLMARVRDMGFRCILVYGTMAEFDPIYVAAERYGLQVIAIIWLDGDATFNQASIAAGIQRAKAQPQIVVRLSCGSEVRIRHGVAVAEPIIRDCLTQVVEAGVSKPVGYIDSWWGWCDEAWPCRTWGLASQVDWIGVNIYPWWENKYSGLYPCTPAEDAAAFTVARYQAMRDHYSGREVLLTEFGWPAGPDDYMPTNAYTGQQCGVASPANQHLVIEQTLDALDAAGLSGILFQAFREPWKVRYEGPVGEYWGVCSESAPYTCPFAYGMRWRSFLPLVLTMRQ